MGDKLFEDYCQSWLTKHIIGRRGENRSRIKEGLGHAEKLMLQNIWWPAFGHFQHLHPEYEIQDFSEGYRYIDFAYVRSHIRVAIEIDGYGTHLRHNTRKQFCDQWVRQMHLTNDNWTVIRIGYDDIEQRPRLWQQLFQQMVGRLFGAPGTFNELHVYEREILRLAAMLERPFQLSDVRGRLHCSYNKARPHIRKLEESEWIRAALGGATRTHAWSLEPSKRMFIH